MPIASLRKQMPTPHVRRAALSIRVRRFDWYKESVLSDRSAASVLPSLNRTIHKISVGVLRCSYRGKSPIPGCIFAEKSDREISGQPFASSQSVDSQKLVTPDSNYSSPVPANAAVLGLDWLV